MWTWRLVFQLFYILVVRAALLAGGVYLIWNGKIIEGLMCFLIFQLAKISDHIEIISERR